MSSPRVFHPSQTRWSIWTLPSQQLWDCAKHWFTWLPTVQWLRSRTQKEEEEQIADYAIENHFEELVLTPGTALRQELILTCQSAPFNGLRRDPAGSGHGWKVFWPFDHDNAVAWYWMCAFNQMKSKPLTSSRQRTDIVLQYFLSTIDKDMNNGNTQTVNFRDEATRSLAIETLVQMEPGIKIWLVMPMNLPVSLKNMVMNLKTVWWKKRWQNDQSNAGKKNPDGWLYTDGDFIFGWVRELGLHYYEASYPSEDYPILRLIGHFNSCTQAKNAVEQHQRQCTRTEKE